MGADADLYFCREKIKMDAIFRASNSINKMRKAMITKMEKGIEYQEFRNDRYWLEVKSLMITSVHTDLCCPVEMTKISKW